MAIGARPKNGSLSNVGVRRQRQKDSGSEGVEAAETKGDSFEDLYGVVAAFREPVGQWYIESVEYVGVSVFQHSAASLELWEFETIAGVEECFQAMFGGFLSG